MQARNRSQSGPEFQTDGSSEERLHDALTDLNAYAMTLDLDRHRVEVRLLELALSESSGAERRALAREQIEMTDELQALRWAIAALEQFLPPQTASG
jgi:hypothetical protein